MVEVLLTTAYFAPVSYYAYMMHASKVCIEQCEHYHKQSYRNRCLIAAANGTMFLSIPVENKNNQDIRSVRMQDMSSWRHRHWISIVSAYQSSPYFEYYQDDLLPFFERPCSPFLFDFNEALRQKVCDLLDLHPTISFSEDFEKNDCSRPDYYDLREAIHPKKDSSKLPGYRPEPYIQVFGQNSKFQPELSILDLLFNMGPEALLTLQKSISL